MSNKPKGRPNFKAGPGRPPGSTEPVPWDIAMEFCKWVSLGKPATRFCKQPGKPSWATISDWAHKDPEFARQVATARLMGCAVIADDALQIADEGLNDTYTDEKGNTKILYDVVARSRLRVETRLRLLERWDPRATALKLALGGDAEAPPIKTQQLTDAERLHRLQAILGVAAGRPSPQLHGLVEEQNGPVE